MRAGSCGSALPGPPTPAPAASSTASFEGGQEDASRPASVPGSEGRAALPAPRPSGEAGRAPARYLQRGRPAPAEAAAAAPSPGGRSGSAPPLRAAPRPAWRALSGAERGYDAGALPAGEPARPAAGEGHRPARGTLHLLGLSGTKDPPAGSPCGGAALCTPWRQPLPRHSVGDCQAGKGLCARAAPRQQNCSPQGPSPPPRVTPRSLNLVSVEIAARQASRFPLLHEGLTESEEFGDFVLNVAKKQCLLQL